MKKCILIQGILSLIKEKEEESVCPLPEDYPVDYFDFTGESCEKYEEYPARNIYNFSIDLTISNIHKKLLLNNFGQ